MKVFHSPDSVLHAPDLYFRRGKFIPHFEQPERYRILKTAAERGGHELTFAPAIDDTPILRVHSPRYVRFLSEAWYRREEIEPGLAHVLPSHFARPQMFHYPDGMVGRVGFHMADTSTPIMEHTFESVLASASAAVAAADEALASGYAYALCRPPGHHASAESAGGFCFINNTAIAAAHLQQALNCQVGVVDIDVHHGNGTQSIFYGRDDVVTASVHADPSTFMPYYAGYADESGDGRGRGYNLNLPLVHGSADAVFLTHVAHALEFCITQGAEALVIALGLDASEHDPNGVMKVTREGFREAGFLLAGAAVPTALIQEGGYLSEHLGDNLLAFLEGFEAGRRPL
jgi:acetoin utilization deacetylase AcuC-like enzyme